MEVIEFDESYPNVYAGIRRPPLEPTARSLSSSSASSASSSSSSSSSSTLDPLVAPFRTFVIGATNSIETRVEIRMMAASVAIRNKPQWWTKYKQDNILNKWKTELRLEEDVWKYIRDELEWYESQRDDETGVQHSVVEGTYQSDALVSVEVRDKLIEQITASANEQTEQDWHPGSNQQEVLGLVHPSLYPLINGVTAIRKLDDPIRSVGATIDASHSGEIVKATFVDANPDDYWSTRVKHYLLSLRSLSMASV